MRRPLRNLLATALLLPLLSFPVRAQVYDDVIELEEYVRGLEWVNDTLYAASSFPDDVLLRVDYENEIAETVFTLDFHPRGVAWDGANWRISTGFDSSDPGVFTISPNGAVLDTIPAPSSLTLGLTLHDGLLFASRAYPDEEAAIAGLDPNDGTELETIAFPETQPFGIAFIAPDTLWATNSGTDGSDIYKLYKTHRSTGEVLQELLLPAGSEKPYGLAYDGEQYLYLATQEQGGTNRLIYKIDLHQEGNPDISLSTTSIDFGPQVFDSSYEESFTIGNDGDGVLDISNVEISSPDASVFETDLEETTVPVNGDLSVSVGFLPTEFGPREAILSFETNDIASPTVEIELSGVGIYENQHIAHDPDALDFGDVRIDPSSNSFSAVRQELAIMNQGQDALSVTDIATDDDAFTVLGASFPIELSTLDTAIVEIEFRPRSVQAYTAEATIASDDPANPSATVSLSGEGINPDLDGGNIVWTLEVPDNPTTTSPSDKISSIAIPGDLTGDGIPDLVFASRNYLVWAVDGNGWGQTSVLWTFNSCPGNNNCGAVAGGSLQLYEYGIDSGADLDSDGINDIVIGTEGGNDHVYALSGVDGSVIWEVGSDTDPYLAGYYSVDVGRDVTGDGIAEVATGTGSASDSSPNPYNHRKVYLFDGATGDEIWERSTSQPHYRTSMFMNDGEAYVAAGGGDLGDYVVAAWHAETGNPEWEINPSSTPFLVEPFVVNADGDEDLLTGGLGNSIQRIDGGTGDNVWTRPNLGTSVWDIEAVNRGGNVPDIIVGTIEPEVYLLDGEEGTIEWEYNLDDQVFDVAPFPDADDDGIDDVAAVGKGGDAVLLSGADGSLIWSYHFGNGSFDESGEVVAAVPDIDNNGIAEFAFGTRDGRAFLLFGGGNPIDTRDNDFPDNRFSLRSPYPNPFSARATVPFEIGSSSHVRIALYDVLGREVAVPIDGQFSAGRHEAVINASTLATGTYLLRATVEPHRGKPLTVSQRVTVVK